MSPLPYRMSGRLGRRGRLALVAVLMGLTIADVPAAAQEVVGTYTGGAIGRRVAYERDGRERHSWAGSMNLMLDSGEELRVFCIQLEVPVRSGTRYRSDGPVENLPNGCQIRYVLDNYPAAGDMSPDEAAARQMAVWRFSDDMDLSTIVDDDAVVRDRALEIAGEAEAGACPATRTEAPVLSLEPASARATVGERLEYTVTAGAVDAGRAIHVVVTGPAVLDDGRQQADLALDATGSLVFGVTGTAPGRSTLSINLPYRLGAGTVFSHVEESEPAQRLVMAQVADLVARAAADADWDDTDTPTAPAATATATAPAPSVTPRQATATVAATETPAAPTPTIGVAVTPTTVLTAPSERSTPDSPATAPSAPTVQVPEHLPKTGAPGAPASILLALGVCLCVAGLLAVRRGS